MFFWNSLAFLMIQHMLAIWSLVYITYLYVVSIYIFQWHISFSSLCSMWLNLAKCIFLLRLHWMWLSGKEYAFNAGVARDAGSIPGWGRSPGRGNDNPLQYSCLENPMDRGAWKATIHGVAELDMTEATQHAHMQGGKRPVLWKLLNADERN